jgi:hypothetical protein
MAKKKPIPKSAPPARRKKTAFAQDLGPLTAAIRSLFTIEGVEGIGEPVTVLSPTDLPPDVLGFVERLRAGPIELDDEMLFITLAGLRGRPRRGEPVVERLREALLLLCRYATDNGVAAGDVWALLDETKRRVSRTTGS